MHRDEMRDAGKRREYVKKLVCSHKIDTDEDDDGIFFICDKTKHECLLMGRCPIDIVADNVDPS